VTLRGILLAIFVFLLARAVRKVMTKGEKPKPLPAKKRPRRALPKPAPPPVPMVDDEPAHEILGVEPDAPIDEVRGAYQRLMREHHPDLVASRGAEEQASAESNAKRLSRAYEALKARQGE
jgi:DnaJ-domain-containing protein 1